MKFDLVVIGGGIVGIATALSYQDRYPDTKVLVLEKEAALARHQTGNNSGVIHAGVYYAPGSLKAQLCRKGAVMVKEFCQSAGIEYEECGKLIVATNPVEIARLKDLRERAVANGIPYEDVNGNQLRLREPLIKGLEALFFPESAIVDYGLVTRRMADRITARGGEIRLNARVTAIRESADSVTVECNGKAISAGRLVVCGGAQADRLARMAGLKTNFRIVPFRGEYYQVDPALRPKINHLIYPVPDPDLPFLGIHLTHEVNNRLSVGPNAVLGLSREGLPRFSINLRDMLSYLTYPGFWKFLKGNLRSGLSEMRNSLFTGVYLEACRKYIPSLTRRDLQKRKAGVRAQVIMDDGTIMHDFLVMETKRMVHICNAPSPAATSSLAIAGYILDNYIQER
ncbi:MAG: hydroxyglutarate oxidase [Rhodobacterales bacterium 65-51]|uniref:L-2-hydroxyglutarate oxidase n=1 Tax=uncultured Gemmobacter sp. TaxID=1095917 RepID=UPI00095FBB49|nr:L-2-hydroxyglutarate oxidase [uncultured Gemmobacter sp.]OJY36670.1 MAG: hydroxyglutarate oxidase [Rhodobacterales bacterium 65-51]